MMKMIWIYILIHPKNFFEKEILKKIKKEVTPINYNWLRDIFTILFIGFIIIFMCDVIARIAISIGMQKQFVQNQFS